MLYILLIFTCSNSFTDLLSDTCTVEPTVHMDISFDECEVLRMKMQQGLAMNQMAVCVQQDTE